MSDAAEIVVDTVGGRTFRASRRTFAHLDYTIDRLPAGCALRVIQGCFNTTVAASAGTHDKDACLDVEVVGMSWLDAQWFLRQAGWAAFYRTPAQGFTPHLHMVSIGYPGGPSAVGIYVPAQVDDYYRHALGLKGQHNSGADRTRFPTDIASTVFDYQSWKDAHMPLNDADLKKISDLIDQRLDVFVATPKIDVNGKTWSLVTLWKSTWSKAKGA